MLSCLLLAACAAPAGETPPEPAAEATPLLLETEQASPEASPPEVRSGALSVLFINVGYGDATLITYQGRSLMIDTGKKSAAAQVFAALNYMGVTKLDAVALTHTHSDHIGGLEALGRSIPVGHVYAATISQNKKDGGNRITELCQKLSLPLTRLNAGETLPLTETVSLEVLGPLSCNADDDNDNSLILRLTLNGRTLLLTGDMQFDEETTLLDAGAELAADILKVGNHGNPDATGDLFGAAVSPQYAVISTSTAEDADSANPRVRTALSDAEIHVTEDYPLGVLVMVEESGEIRISSPETQKSEAELMLSLDIEAQRATVTNTGADEADLSCFVLLSDRGGECFRFPEDTRLPAGASLSVSAEGGGGDFAFIGESSPWNRKRGDTALLYDAGGHLTARAEG